MEEKKEEVTEVIAKTEQLLRSKFNEGEILPWKGLNLQIARIKDNILFMVPLSFTGKELRARGLSKK